MVSENIVNDTPDATVIQLIHSSHLIYQGLDDGNNIAEILLDFSLKFNGLIDKIIINHYMYISRSLIVLGIKVSYTTILYSQCTMPRNK